MEPGESCVICTNMERVDTKDKKYVWFVTKNGLIKKTALSEYAGFKRKTGMQATGLREGDSIASVWIGDDSDILMVSEEGMVIRFASANITATGKTAIGVQGIKLGSTDHTSFACNIHEGDRLLVVYDNGYGCKISESDFTRQNRAGKGVKLCRVNGSKICAGITIVDNSLVLISGDASNICIDETDIKLGSRTSMPIKLIKDNKIVSIARV